MFSFSRFLRQISPTSSPRNRHKLRLEGLESRLAPATMVSPTKLTYQDKDGDTVTVTFSKPILNAVDPNTLFTFDSGAGAVNDSNATKEQLQKIILTGVVSASGTTITTSAVRSTVNFGDGFAALGEIDATGLDLGVVTIDGDLGRIRAGDGTFMTAGLKALTVQSLGRFGTSTGAVDLHTVIQGALGSLKVKSDIKEAHVETQGGADGKIGTVTIGGSLLGGASQYSGRIVSSGALGAAKIGGSIQGGSGEQSGVIHSNGTLAGVTLGGSLLGGAGRFSGRIRSSGTLGAVKIGGTIQGGSGNESGEIVSYSTLAGVTLGGSLLGGSGDSSGHIHSSGALGAVKIGGNIQGGSGPDSGEIRSISTLAGVTIGGSLLGGAGTYSGHIISFGALGAVKIGGSIQGGSGNESGEIRSDSTLVGATLGGSLLGGSGTASGRIESSGAMGAVKIGGNIQGGSGNASGAIDSGSTLAAVTIGGSLFGGGDFSGRIASAGPMSTVKIGGTVQGGSGEQSGAIVNYETLAGVTIGGSLIGGAGESSGIIGEFGFDSAVGMLKIGGNIQGGSGKLSGAIYSESKVAGVTLGGSLIGGADDSSGSIRLNGGVGMLKIGGNIQGGTAADLDLKRSGYIEAQRIATLVVTGSLIAGVDTDTSAGIFQNNGAIRVQHDIGSATLGSVVGNNNNSAIISARGGLTPTATKDVAIGKLTIKGSVEFAQILAGVTVNGTPVNADAQIGAVVVGGDWIASSLAAGVVPGDDGFYGNGDANEGKMSGAGVTDLTTIASKITSLSIAGQVLGTVGETDFFGMTAENVGTLKVGGTSIPLAVGNSNDAFELGLTEDFNVREI